MSTTETHTATPAIPTPRAPERETLAPWSPAVPAQRGIRWLDAPETTPEPPAGLGSGDLPRGRSRLVVVLLVVALVAGSGAGAALGLTGGPDRTMSVAGSLLVAGRGTLAPGSSCSVSTMPGHTVSVFDGEGRVVGSVVLPTTGTAVDQWQTATPWADACRFSFTVGQVPAGEDSYRVGLDGDPSHTVGFSREELTTTGAQLTSGH